MFKKHSINPIFKGFMECFSWRFYLGNNPKNMGVYFNAGEKQWFDESGLANIAK
ncbi:hypothetical protein [Bacillus cereus group sp. BfR-BA-01316]|uniref:hypothetical protein n=1 Tax=Bacillus cereus group sp. BfR-BA-01316 TaxID=2920293 RepID=UPI001F59ABCB|nr:hypothetical protein [Bacillus cereus group sp. BfR-BA-01316]